MSILYTKITFMNDEEMVILNSDYTKERLRRLLLRMNHTQDYVSYIVKKSMYVRGLRKVKIKAGCDDHALLTTVYENGREEVTEFSKTTHIYVYPDGAWRKETFKERLVQKRKK